MATTFVSFAPSNTANFRFQATFDAKNYIVVITWNLFGERYYVNIYDTSQNLIVCQAMVGSPLNYNISLTAGYFATQLVWRIQNGQFEVID